MLHNGSVLAYMGDAIMSLQVREYLIGLNITHPKKLLETSTLFVSAINQAEYVQYVLDQQLLHEDELKIYKRGYNYKNHSVAKNADLKSYRMATGLEALWGYWYLNKNETRLKQMWDNYKTYTEEKYGTIYLRQE